MRKSEKASASCWHSHRLCILSDRLRRQLSKAQEEKDTPDSVAMHEIRANIRTRHGNTPQASVCTGKSCFTRPW